MGTLFIIVPCFIDLFSSRDITGNLIGLAIGITLLLACNDVISFSLFGKLILPVILVIIGIKLIIKAFGRNDSKINEKYNKAYTANRNGRRVHTVLFSGETVKANEEPFVGADLVAIFGGIDLDMRGAIIETDVIVNATTVFGGIEIIVPPNVQIVVKSTSIFGGVDNQAFDDPLAEHTVFVNATCVFGGIDIK